MRQPKIIGVAVEYEGRIYSLLKPFRHHHVIREIGGIYGPHVEGFVTSDEHFLTRTEAMQLAKDNGQLNRRAGAQHYQGPELYSEDLW